MGATLHRDFKVFKAFVGINDDDLFGNGETVIVMSEQAEKNCYPHSYKWRFEYIGGLNSFQQSYLPRTAYFYDDGQSQSPLVENGKQFSSHIKRLYELSDLLTVDQLHALGWYGYSWSEECFQKTTRTPSHKRFSNYLGTRYAHRLDGDDDVARMLREACDIVPPGSAHPWMAGLWRVDGWQFDEIERATESEDLKTAV